MTSFEQNNHLKGYISGRIQLPSIYLISSNVAVEMLLCTHRWLRRVMPVTCYYRMTTFFSNMQSSELLFPNLQTTAINLM